MAMTVVGLEVKNLEELRGIMNRLSAIRGVAEVKRNGGSKE